MRALDRKTFRDGWNLRRQFLAIAVVIGCGVGTLVMAWSMLGSLRSTQVRYYDRHRMGHVFAHVKRAPLAAKARLARLPGVVHVDARIVVEAILELPGATEPASAKLVSLPDDPTAGLGTLHLRSGRLPVAGRGKEIVIGEGFAQARGVRPGDSLTAVLNGKRERLQVVGVGLSPEFVYQVRPGDFIPNDATYGVFWASREELEATYDLKGSFNDVVMRLAPGESDQRAIDGIDAVLSQYGGRGAYALEMQASNRFVQNELRELRNMGFVAPAIFLLVAAALLNVVVARLVAAQRTQIATLRAFGYSTTSIAWHYVKMIAAVALVGTALGTGLGVVLGRGMTLMYARFFRFPTLDFRVEPLAVAAGAAASVLAATSGIFVSVARAASAPPAAAMQPEPPAAYRTSLFERFLPRSWTSPSTRMILRNIERRPLQSTLSILGLGMAGAVVVLGNQSADAIGALMQFQFRSAQRQTYTLAFVEPTDHVVVNELRRLPGVMEVEPFRAAAAEFRFGAVRRRQEIVGLDENATLVRAIDRRLRIHAPSPGGVVLSQKLGELLGARPGDVVEVELLEGVRARMRLRVEWPIEDLVGTSAYVPWRSLSRALGEPTAISGAHLRTDGGADDKTLKMLRESPRVAGVSSMKASERSLRDTLAATMLRMRAINLGFAAAIACGVAYNAARIALADRARDLASMRILGYTRGEISYILVGEIVALAIVAVPVGWAMGWGLTKLASWGYDTELFRVPIAISRATNGLATVLTLGASIASALLVRRQLDTLDLVAVLKTRE